MVDWGVDLWNKGRHSAQLLFHTVRGVVYIYFHVNSAPLQPEAEPVEFPSFVNFPFKDWTSAGSMENNPRGLKRTESGSGGESDGRENSRRYLISTEQPRRLPSSQYKGVVPQPNGRWGAQIYEKQQRLWLGTFNREEDAARAYDRAAIKVRGREATTNFSPVGDGDLEAQFMKEHSKEQIVEMLRKHTYDEEIMMRTIDRSATMNNAEASGEVIMGSGQGRVCEEKKEHLFDKAVTLSDVGKLNRLVIPKQYAEKYLPLDVNSSERGMLLNFEDYTGKVWRFHYSYWNSSQRYVLTKGWNRFVKEKKLEAGHIVSFHRGSAQPLQLHISWRRRPSGRPRLGVSDPQSHQSNMRAVNSLCSLNPFNSGTQSAVVYNAQWMPVFWSASRNPNTFLQFNSKSKSISHLITKVGHVDTLWSESHCVFPFYCPPPPNKETDVSHLITKVGHVDTLRSESHCVFPFYCPPPPNKETDVSPDQLDQKLLNSGDGSDIKLAPGLSAAQESDTPEQKAGPHLAPASKKGVRLFGVTLLEGQRFSPQHLR